MPVSPAYPLQVFFDGSCSVCAAKMAVYRRKKHDGRLRFVDITAQGFDPAPYGISLEAFMYEMHAIDRESRVYRGVEAFRAIWQALPASTLYGALGWLITVPGVHLMARLAYWSFARIRKFLPKNREDCTNGSCGLGKGRSPR